MPLSRLLLYTFKFADISSYTRNPGKNFLRDFFIYFLIYKLTKYLFGLQFAIFRFKQLIVQCQNIFFAVLSYSMNVAYTGRAASQLTQSAYSVISPFPDHTLPC